MRAGLIARCGVRGGLTVQTHELARHIEFDKILVVHTDHDGRGKCDRSLYPSDNVTWLRADPSPQDAVDFMRGLDVVFSCECLYQADWMLLAQQMGVAVVVQANPEMFDARELAGARVVLPTPWESHRVPHEQILPVPVALDRFSFRQRTQARVFYHPTAPAMLDRNGTSIVLASLQHITAEVAVVIRGELTRGELARRRDRVVPDNVKLVELPWTEAPYWSAYPDEADVLLLPRRYGGLCLPMQESAALGMPTLTTDLEPQRGYPHAVFVDASPHHMEPMKLGQVMVHKADPRALAAQIDRLATGAVDVGALSDAARQWAAALAWSAWEQRYRVTLGA